MTAPHDFEFQFGRYKALRGRGWRGLLALALIVSCVTLMSGNIGTAVASPLAGRIMHLISAPETSK